MATRRPINQLQTSNLAFFGRSNELAVLETCFYSIINLAGGQEEPTTAGTITNTCSSRFVTVAGYSGTGKSRLVHAFLSRCSEIRERSAYSCTGKCDETRIQEPFSVVREALQELCSSLLESQPYGTTTEEIANDIRTAVGEEGAAVLTDVLPGLSDLIGETTLSSSSNTQDTSIATDRLQSLF